MTTATLEIRTDEENETFDVYEDGDYANSHDTRKEAREYIAERQAELDEEAKEEAEDARREELRQEIAELLENVHRLDSLEGLLKSVKRLQD